MVGIDINKVLCEKTTNYKKKVQWKSAKTAISGIFLAFSNSSNDDSDDTYKPSESTVEEEEEDDDDFIEISSGPDTNEKRTNKILEHLKKKRQTKRRKSRAEHNLKRKCKYCGTKWKKRPRKNKSRSQMWHLWHIILCTIQIARILEFQSPWRKTASMQMVWSRVFKTRQKKFTREKM